MIINPTFPIVIVMMVMLLLVVIIINSVDGRVYTGTYHRSPAVQNGVEARVRFVCCLSR